MTSVPTLTGRRVYLREVTPADYDHIREAESSQGLRTLYRTRGVSISPHDFARSLWSGVLVQFLVCANVSGSRLGVVCAYSPDHRNGHAKLAAVLFPGYEGRGWAIEGIELFISYMFRVFPLRKLYAEIFEPNLAQLPSLERFGFWVEGRLKEHEYHDGRYRDQLIYSLRKEDWLEYGGISKRGSLLSGAVAKRVQDPERMSG